MATSTGYKAAGTVVNDTTVGTIAWSNPSNATTSNDTSADAVLSGTQDLNVDDESDRLVIENVISGNDKASSLNWAVTDTERTYGSTTDTWGLTITSSNVNSSTFGCAVAAQIDNGGAASNYLKATNFGFQIPGGAKILGVQVKIECRYENGLGGGACFVQGTPVLGKHRGKPRYRAIQTLKLGSEIFTRHPKNGRLVSDTVVGLIAKVVNGIYELRAGSEVVLVTGNHRFFTDRGLVSASNLRNNDSLHYFRNNSFCYNKIDSIKKVSGTFYVYDIQTKTFHSFIANGFFVHNVLISGSTTAFVDAISMQVTFGPVKDQVRCGGSFTPFGRT